MTKLDSLLSVVLMQVNLVLINTILGEERVIASDIAGTTRDAIDTDFKHNGDEYVVIDTAGIRKRGKVYESCEKYSVLRSLKLSNVQMSSQLFLMLRKVLLNKIRKLQDMHTNLEKV